MSLLVWTNWSGKLVATPLEIAEPHSEGDVVEIVRRSSGSKIRCVGAGHSHAPLVVTDGIVLDTSALVGVMEIDLQRREALIGAGARISSIGEPLRKAGLALKNQGDIDRQSIAGAVCTGTHGTGPSLQNLSASVVGVRVVLADGSTLDCGPDCEPELFEVARLSLGAVGVVTRVRLSLRDPYKLEEKMWLEDLDAVLDRIDELSAATRHFEFFWMPGMPRAACKSLAETDAEPRYPLAAEGSRLAWSYDVLANERNDKHSEMEYSVPAEHGPECLRALRDLIATEFPDLAWPLEFRTLAADSVWLSSAYRRPTVTISVHQGVGLDDEPLFRCCEEVFLRYHGRPHWGKVHYLGGGRLAAIHERWSDWWRVRDHYDPQRRFVNRYLEGLFGG
ncbi:MAG: D-arabinono-1,4-lactone oxidase [Myxococcota bacterium]